jgi:hypothetical protein
MLPYEEYDTYKDSDIEWIGRIPAHWSKNTKYDTLKVFGAQNVEG